MATPRPYKQLPLLPLVRVSPRRPRALTTLSGGNSLRTPSWPPSPAPPSSLPATRPGSAHSRPRAPRRARRGARLGAPAEVAGTVLRPTHFPSGLLRGVDGSWDAACGAGGQGWVHAWGFPFLSSGLRVAISRFCGLSLSPDRVSSWCPQAGLTLQCHLPLRSAETAAPVADTPRWLG